MIDLYLIRHGKTAGNMEGRYVGSTDESLCEEGTYLENITVFAKDRQIPPFV